MTIEGTTDEAVQLRAALAAAQLRIENLEVALATARTIGTAIGVVMAINKVTADEAFELLRIASQNRSQKLRDIARYVVDTGEVPGTAPRNDAGGVVRLADTG